MNSVTLVKKLSVFLLANLAQVTYDFAGLMYTNTRRFVA
jgi:hypothetical protein